MIQKSLVIVVFIIITFNKVFSQKRSSDNFCQVSPGTEPCQRFNTLDIPCLESRHPSIKYTGNFLDESKYCDKNVLTVGKWYIADWKMTNTCVEPETCGSRFPIWLNGTHPTVAENIVTRDGCVRDHSSCCITSYEVQIKNCTSYTVYCFLQLPSACPQRYCFDIDLSKVTTQSTQKTNPTTTAVEKGTSGSQKLGVSPVLVLLLFMVMNCRPATETRISV